MIYITGDTHIPLDIQKLSTQHFPQQKEMTEDDYVIICGDFGGVWDGSREEKYWIKWLKSKNFTTLFIDGNHENFEMLGNLPVTELCGGRVHRVDDGIYHLMRGEIYNISEKNLLVFGGGSSHDKEHRAEGKNWWKDEMPCKEEYVNAENNLKKVDFKIDYVITHSAPTSVQQKIAPDYQINALTDFLEGIKNTVSFQKWFFGHYHKDMVIDENFIAVFNEIVETRD